MDLSNTIVLAIIVTSFATYISRLLGAMTSEKVSAKSKIFEWFNLVAYSTLAALLGRIIRAEGLTNNLTDFISSEPSFEQLLDDHFFEQEFTRYISLLFSV